MLDTEDIYDCHVSVSLVSWDPVNRDSIFDVFEFNRTEDEKMKPKRCTVCNRIFPSAGLKVCRQCGDGRKEEYSAPLFVRRPFFRRLIDGFRMREDM